MNESKLHRPTWYAPSSGGSKRPEFCRSCGIRRGQPASHPVHYADRDDRGGWAIYCNRYGEWTATGLSFASADREAKANESGTSPCGCEPQPSEDEVLTAALAALDTGDPQPVLNAAASGILPTDAPVVAQAWALAERHDYVAPTGDAALYTDKPCARCGGTQWSDEHVAKEPIVSQAAETNATISESIAGTINLRPTDEGFARIAERFATSILFDLPLKRREDSRHLLDSMIEIVAYLAIADPAQVKWLRDEITRRS